MDLFFTHLFNKHLNVYCTSDTKTSRDIRGNTNIGSILKRLTLYKVDIYNVIL